MDELCSILDPINWYTRIDIINTGINYKTYDPEEWIKMVQKWLSLCEGKVGEIFFSYVFHDWPENWAGPQTWVLQ